MADLDIIGTGGVKIGGLGIIDRWTTPTAFVGSGGVKVSGIGTIQFSKPGVLSIVGAGGVDLSGEGVIAFITPTSLAVVGSVAIKIGGAGVIAFTALPILSIVGSAGVKVGGQGIIGRVLGGVPVLSVVGAGGIVVGGTGVIALPELQVLAIIGSGGIKIGEFRVPELTVVAFITPADLTLAAITGAGGVEVGGTGVIVFSLPSVFAVPAPQTVESANIMAGGSGTVAFIHPQIMQIIGDGGVALGADQSEEDIFATYVLTGARGEPSIYANFPFNSYAKFRNQYYGAGPSGIYLLGGSDDAGKAIRPGIRIGPMNFGTDREKRLRLLRCGGITTGAQVKVTNENGSAGYYDIESGRAGVSREIQGRELTIEIVDFETLDHLELVPLILHKR